MVKKTNILGSADKWTGVKRFTVSYQVVTALTKTSRWPIDMHIAGVCIELHKEVFEIGELMKCFVKRDGLSQSTLWDTYREHGVDVSVSRIRR